MESLIAIDTITIAPFLKLGFYLMLAGYMIFTIILYYHWQNYAMDARATTITYAVYAVATIPLLVIMGAIAFFLS